VGSAQGIGNKQPKYEIANVILDPEGAVRCIMLQGYFQYKNTCRLSAAKMWPLLSDRGSPVFTQVRPRIAFGPNDLVIHLRCEQSHYGKPGEKSRQNRWYACHVILTIYITDKQMIERIMNSSRWDRTIIVHPANCTGSSYRSLIESLRATQPSTVFTTSNDAGLEDFVLLVLAPYLVEDRGTFSYWAGVFSNATEKHVYLKFNGISSDDPAYIYHARGAYFMRYVNGSLVPARVTGA
jgi:hypothetical protein